MRLKFKSVNHRKVGDRFRDDHNWKQAATAYRKYLDGHPDEAPIWIQYGHALKEDGKAQEAEEAYRTATTIAADDLDGWIHLAHLLKRQKRHTSALDAFRKASALGGGDEVESAIKELMRMIQTEFPVTRTTHQYLFSIQDMMGYLEAHPTMSGIQRVQAGLALAFIEMEGLDVGFIQTDFTGALDRGSFWLLRNSDVKEVIDYASGANVDHSKLRKMLVACERNAAPISAGSGNTIILLGAFWGLGNTVDQFLPAKKAGARLAAYIYDIIPISHPQYCDATLAHAFTIAIGELCLAADYLLTISDYTRVTIDKFLADNGGRKIPSATVPLAHSLTGPPSQIQAWPRSMQRLRGREYVTYVSTIEGRKNHAYVVNVWRKLIEQGVDVPDLVFVGRKGWRISGLLDLLEATRNLGGRVHIVHDLTDAELNAVYENNLFTVFTSFIEGWGLPVGESLMHHIPCVASQTSSIPEVGGDFIDYVDPENIQTGVDVIGRMITDRAYLAERKRNIVENFKPRGWDEVARVFVEQMQAHEHLPVVSVAPSPLAEGLQFRPGDLMDSQAALIGYVANPSRLLVAVDFYPTESWGVWMRGNYGEVVFQTELPEGTPVMVYVNLQVTAQFADCRAILTVGDDRSHEGRRLTRGEIIKKQLFRVAGRVGGAGVCKLSIEVEGEWEPFENDSRNFSIGILGLGYARTSNIEARADLLESFTFASATINAGAA